MFACVWAESGPGPVWPSCADTATLQIQAHAFANNATPALAWANCQPIMQPFSDKTFKQLKTPKDTEDEYVICF